MSDNAYTLDVASKACKENASRPMNINEVDSWRTSMLMPCEEAGRGTGVSHRRRSNLIMKSMIPESKKTTLVSTKGTLYVYDENDTETLA